MTGFPSNVSFGTVKGRFGTAELLADDADGVPDFSPLIGLEVIFTATVDAVLDRTADPDPVTIVMDPVTGTIDEATGYLLGGDGNEGVKLIATDDTDIDPHDFTYDITYSGSPWATKLPKASITVPAGSTRWITNITDAPSSTGVSLTIAEAAQDAAATSAAEAAATAASLAALHPDIALADAAVTAAQASATAAAGSATTAGTSATAAASSATAADASADAAAASAVAAAASAAEAGGGGGGGTTDVQIFYADGTWTKPASGTVTSFYLVAAGGGGTEGSTSATSTDSIGGDAGSGGGRTAGVVATASLGSTEAVVVGAGGTGLAGSSASNHAPGTPIDGTDSSFAGFFARGGLYYDIGDGQFPGTIGSVGASGANGLDAASPPMGGAALGGSAGGGLTAANLAGRGGDIHVPGDFVEWGLKQPGFDDGAAGRDGDSRPNGTALGGVGGMGGSASVAGNGGKGGNGGLYGGGGGGGGAARNTHTSGAGGDGAPGIVVVVTQ